MPKTKISEYSTTNALNTDIESINIDEGCAPSGINNAIRELMVHLKEFQTGASGDPLTVAGTFVASGSATLNGTSIPASKTLATTADTNTFTVPQIISANSSSDALRITQTGAGNALVVEDSTNPDSTPFVVDASGNVIIGTSSPASTSYSVYVESTSGVLTSTGSNTAATSPTIGTSRRRTGLASVVSGDSLGKFSGFGWDATSFIEAARIESAVDGTPGTNDMPGRLVFSTTADGASSPTERMRIDSSGRVGIGSSSLSGYGVRIEPAVTGSTGINQVRVAGAAQSDVTGSLNYITTSASTAAASFTLPNLRHFLASQGTFGATSTVTNQFGFAVDTNLTGATNNYGFYSNIASGTGRWNFYANGTAANYFAGNVGIATTSPGSALDVKGTLRLSGSSSGYVGLAPAAAAGSTTYTLPSADGTSGQVLSTNGSGTLSWATAGGGGSWTYLSTVTASASSTLDIETTFDSTYDMYAIVVTGLVVSGSGVNLRARFKTNGTYKTVDYKSIVFEGTSAGWSSDTATAGIQLALSIGTSSGECVNFVMYLNNPSSTSLIKTLFGTGSYGTAARTLTFSGIYEVPGEAVTGVRIYPNTGTLTSGSARLYGIKKN